MMKRKKLILIVSLISFSIMWFVAIDWSWFVHDCPDCGYGEDITQYRILTIPIDESVKEFPSITQQVATDLGVPCKHPKMVRWHKHRHWGLLYCQAPCHNGLHRIADSNTWYDEDMSNKVIALADREPSLKTEFANHVYDQHDFNFVDVVLDKARAQDPAE